MDAKHDQEEHDPDQAWFWTPEWQAGERRVDEQLARGEWEEFENVDAFIEHLKGIESS